MEANKILEADILDIVFDGRNKEYGAYSLRKHYNRRLGGAIGAMMVVVAVLSAGYVLAGKGDTAKNQPITVVDNILTEIPDAPPPAVIPPPLPQPKLPQVETVMFTPPVVVPNEDVPENEQPPAIETLEDSRIGLISQHGVKDDDIVAPPITDGHRGILTVAKKQDNAEEIFRKVEIQSEYPGGPEAWMRYLNKTFRYPEEAASTEMQGTVVVQFIVDQAGNISDVEALSGPASGGLREEAVRVIRMSGKWEPAIQNGRKVKSYKKQPIVFKLDVE